MTTRPLTDLLATSPTSALALTVLPRGSVPPVMRGATNGPLASLIPVYIDIESHYDEQAGITLKRQTLRQYLRDSHLTSLAVAIGQEEPVVIVLDHGKLRVDDIGLPAYLASLASDPRYVFVAHNAAFDIRGLVHWLGMPFPCNVWCSLEGSMATWPEFPGGYSLKNLAAELGFPPSLQKLDIDLTDGKHTEDELVLYNARDVLVLRELYLRQSAVIPTREQEVGLMTHQVRKWRFQVDPERLDHLVEALDAAAANAEALAGAIKMDDDDVAVLTAFHLREIFNHDDGNLKSVRSQRLKNILEERFVITVPTTSLKKLSPVFQAKNSAITQVLTQASRVNKMLSHRRKSQMFAGTPEVDVELGYFRAHTGRFSSPAVGKGLNLHNVPKHDVAIAKPIRQIFRLPPDKCFVRGDLANVEYRIEGWLTGCTSVMKMFDEKLGGNRFSDPYVKAWKSMTNMEIAKKDPVRQVAKGAVLGLGFGMGASGYAKVLLAACGDPTSKITEATLAAMIHKLGWTVPGKDRLAKIRLTTGCSDVIAMAAFHIHHLFNHAHSEFKMTADWLVRSVTEVAACGRNAGMASRRLERMRTSEAAPDPTKIHLSIDSSLTGLPSVRVQCGPWPATVCWREPALRDYVSSRGAQRGLTILKGSGQVKPFTPQLAIENVTQAAARNALCAGLLTLKQNHGIVDALHVHDEVLLIVDRTREAVLKAKEILVSVFGPTNSHPMDWAVLIKPDEISVTESLWEDEVDIMKPVRDEKTGVVKGGDRWGRIERDDPGCFDCLP